MATRPKGNPHKRPYDEKCGICTHKDKDAIEDLYFRFAYQGRKAPLARQFGFTVHILSNHMEATGLKKRRANNTDDLVAALVDMKMENLKPEEITVPELVKLIKHVDVREGRVVHRVQDVRPQIVKVLASPSPGGQLPPPSSSLPLALIEADFAETQEKTG